MTEPGFELVGSRVLGRGVFLELEEQRLVSSAGVEVVRDIVHHPGGVAILPIDGDRVWLIRQHRAALDREVEEIPAGKLDPDDDDVEAAARRELAEELGAEAEHFSRLATMAPSPGYTDEIIEIFLAEGLTFGRRNPDGEEEKRATVFALPIATALDSIDRGEVIDAKTQVALLQWKRRQA